MNSKFTVIFGSAFGMRNHLAVRARYRLGSRNCYVGAAVDIVCERHIFVPENFRKWLDIEIWDSIARTVKVCLISWNFTFCRPFRLMKREKNWRYVLGSVACSCLSRSNAWGYLYKASWWCWSSFLRVRCLASAIRKARQFSRLLRVLRGCLRFGGSNPCIGLDQLLLLFLREWDYSLDS